jgi:hypothetical protein
MERNNDDRREVSSFSDARQEALLEYVERLIAQGQTEVLLKLKSYAEERLRSLGGTEGSEREWQEWSLRYLEGEINDGLEKLQH